MYNYLLILAGFMLLAAICIRLSLIWSKKAHESEVNNYNDKTLKLTLILLFGYTIVTAFQLSSENIASGLRNFQNPDIKQVTVKGTASMDVRSDLAVWTASIKTESITLKDGYNQMMLLRDKIQQYLKEKNIPADSVNFSLINKEEIPYYEKYTNDYRLRTNINDFRFNQSFTITYNDVYKIQKLASDINELLVDEINITSNSPNYLYSKLDLAKVELIKKAEQDAKNRAKAMGLNVDNIVAASQGIFQITPRNTNAVEDGGINDMTSIEKTIKSVVTISYEIK